MRHQFLAGRHIDAIDIGVAHGRCSAGQIDLAGTSVARHLHNFVAGGAAHDGIVHQQHVAALEFAGNGVELLPHRLFSHRLPRHDEGATHIAVFHKAFAVRQAQQLRQLRGAGSAGFGDGDDHVNLVGRHGRDHALGQRLAQVQARLVDGDAVHHRVWPRQIDKLKNAGVQYWRVRTLLGVHMALQIDENRFTWLDVALKRVRRAFKRYRFTGQYHRPRTIITAPHTQRPNAKRITKRQHTMPGDQRNHRIRALEAPVNVFDSGKNIGRLQRQATRGAFNLVRQHVEQHFGIALGVDMPVVGDEQLAFERVRIGQVAVVHQHNAERRVHIKRLRLIFAVSIACRGVAHLA